MLVPRIKSRLCYWEEQVETLERELRKSLSQRKKKGRNDIFLVRQERQAISEKLSYAKDMRLIHEESLNSWSSVYEQMTCLQASHEQAICATNILYNITVAPSAVREADAKEIVQKYKGCVRLEHIYSMRMMLARSVVDRVYNSDNKKWTCNVKAITRNSLRKVYNFMPEKAFEEILAMPAFPQVPNFVVPDKAEVLALKQQYPDTFVVHLRRREIRRYLEMGTAGRPALAVVWKPFNYYKFHENLAKLRNMPLPLYLPPLSCARALVFEHLCKDAYFAGSRDRSLASYFNAEKFMFAKVGVQDIDEWLEVDHKEVDKEFGVVKLPTFVNSDRLEAFVRRATPKLFNFWKISLGSRSPAPVIKLISRENEEQEQIGSACFLQPETSGVYPAQLTIEQITSIHSRLQELSIESGDARLQNNKRFHPAFFSKLYRDTLFRDNPVYLMTVGDAVNVYDWMREMDWFGCTRGIDKERISDKHFQKWKQVMLVHIMMELQDFFEKRLDSETEQLLAASKVLELQKARAEYVSALVQAYWRERENVVAQHETANKERAVCVISRFWRHVVASRDMIFFTRRLLYAVDEVQNKLCFFFSDENLRRDWYLVDHINPTLGGVVPYTVLLSFPTIYNCLLGFSAPEEILMLAAANTPGLQACAFGVRRTDWDVNTHFKPPVFNNVVMMPAIYEMNGMLVSPPGTWYQHSYYFQQ